MECRTGTSPPKVDQVSPMVAGREKGRGTKKKDKLGDGLFVLFIRLDSQDDWIPTYGG